MIDEKKTLLEKANRAFRKSEYELALSLYSEVKRDAPDLTRVADFNIHLVERYLNGSSYYSENETMTAYLATVDQVKNSGFWDEQWYITQYRTAVVGLPPGTSSLDYYITQGWKEGHLPSPHFKINNNPFPKDLSVNHVSYFLDVLRYKGYHFKSAGPEPSLDLVNRYISYKLKRRSTKVVYTCIVGGYNELIQPASIDFEWDYVCYTDQPIPEHENSCGVWELRPLERQESSASRTNRWHKMNPHRLFSEYEESIYVDGNINIVGDYCYRVAESTDKLILLPRHFNRKCVYEEVRALEASMRFSHEDKLSFEEQEKFLKEEGYPQNYGLGENNLLYRKHHHPMIVSMMELWAWILVKYSSRDQLGLGYCFWRYGLSFKEHFIENCRINYSNFRLVSHNEKRSLIPQGLRKLQPVFDHAVLAVFSCNDTFVPYLAIAIESLVYHSSAEHHYDVVVLHSSLSDTNIEKLKSIQFGKSNISIRFFFMEDLISSVGSELFPVEGYVPRETYNKCFLLEIFEGYDRCLYLDSDILICDDVAKLYYSDMQGKSLSASRNVANINAAYLNKDVKGVRFRDYLKDVLCIDDYEEYFQAGVVLLDFNRLKDEQLLERSVDALKKIGRPIFFDQCVFNKLFYKDASFFSTAWNHVWYLQDYSYLKSSMSKHIYYDYAKGRSFPKIIHYASGDKYYNKPEWSLANRFWTFSANSKFYPDILEDCEQRLSAPALSKLRTTIKEESWKKPRVLVHLHVFYREQIPFMLDALENVSGVDLDLYVTQVQRDRPSESQILARFPDAKILTIDNAGYDVYPFLVVLGQNRLSRYDFVLKLHTKNSRKPGQELVYGVSVPGDAWRNRLVEALLKSEEVFSSNIAYLQENEHVGCVAAKEFIFSTQENSEERNYSLPYWRGRLGIPFSHEFVGGSMFLAKAFPFERLLDSKFTVDDFRSNEFKTKDYKNLAHIFERLLGLVVGSEGMRIIGR